jgi:hypothetical protein
MATSRNILCGICEAQHMTKYADQWCPECDEGKSNTIFVVCRNAIWTAGFVMVLTEMCIFHIMIFTVITDF